MSNFQKVRVGDMLYTVPHHVKEDIARLVARYSGVSVFSAVEEVEPSEVETKKSKKKAKTTAGQVPEYSKRRKDSIYPIKAGNVLLPDRTMTFFNRKVKARIEHQIFIWVLTERKIIKKGVKPKRRGISVFYFYRPVDTIYKEKYIMTPIKQVQFETVALYLRGGYKVLAEKITYNYRPEDVARFYNIVDLH